MSNVVLTIGGRSFTVACADGEEAHIERLGRLIEDKVAGIGDAANRNESRMLLFAALLLADELVETRDRGNPGSAAAPAVSGAMAQGVAPDQLEALAVRLEKLAQQLEDGAANP